MKSNFALHTMHCSHSSSLTQCGSSSRQGMSPLSCWDTMRSPDLDRTRRRDGVGNMAWEVWDQEDRDMIL